MYRRVEEAWHLRLGADGTLDPVRLAAIDGDRSPRMTGAQRMPSPPMLPTDGGRASLPLVHDPAASAVLATSLGLQAEALEAELTHRSGWLLALADMGVCDPPSVAEAIRAYPDLPRSPRSAPV
jgi:hypothetical protein